MYKCLSPVFTEKELSLFLLDSIGYWGGNEESVEKDNTGRGLAQCLCNFCEKGEGRAGRGAQVIWSSCGVGGAAGGGGLGLAVLMNDSRGDTEREKLVCLVPVGTEGTTNRASLRETGNSPSLAVR